MLLDREKCVARRATTNTPLQALALLNDATYVEAARALRQRVMPEDQPVEAHRKGVHSRPRPSAAS